MKVLVLGAGKMTEAFLTGLRVTENLSEWMIYSPSGTSAQKLAGKVGARAVSDLTVVRNPDLVLIGCKPQQLKDLAVTLGDRFRESLFLSFCAAVTEADQRQVLGTKELIRCMPNLPVEHREGIVLLASLSAKGRLSSFQSLFSKLGTCLVVSEEELEELTLLTGSAPAFFYEFARILAESFTSLNPEQREKLIRQVLKGTAITVSKNPQGLEELTNAVTSKGGVTIAVLSDWRDHKLSELLKAGIAAGKQRAQEIKAILRN